MDQLTGQGCDDHNTNHLAGVEIRYSFQSRFSQGGKAPLKLSARSPAQGGALLLRFSLSHSRPRSTTSKPIGPRPVGERSCAIARFVGRIRSSAMGVAGNRRTTNTMTGFGDSPWPLQSVREDVHLPAALLSALLPLQLDRPQPGTAALFRGRLLLGSCGAHGQRSRSRGRSLHVAPMVPESGFFSAAVFRFCAGRCWPSARWLARTEILVHDSLPLRWHTVFPFLARFWPLRL